jgi:hypothetical protein
VAAVFAQLTSNQKAEVRASALEINVTDLLIAVHLLDTSSIGH